MLSWISLASMPGQIVCVALAGYLSDCIQPYKLFIPGLLAHGLTSYSLTFVDEPKSPQAFIAIALMMSMFFFTLIPLESLFSKNLPANARGAMTILLSMAQDVGSLTYLPIAGRMFDSWGPAAPY